MTSRGRRRQSAGGKRSEPELPDTGISVKAVWTGADRIPLLYANHVFVRLQDGVFLTTFGQSELPHEVGQLSQETQERLQQEGLPIHTVVRLVIPPERMEQILYHMNDIYSRWQQSQRIEEK